MISLNIQSSCLNFFYGRMKVFKNNSITFLKDVFQQKNYPQKLNTIEGGYIVR